MTPAIRAINDVAGCEAVLRKLLLATLKRESIIAERDTEIASIQAKHAPALLIAQQRIQALESSVEAFYVSHRAELEMDGKKSVQLQGGVIGMRTPANPALVPLNDKWTWEKIEAKLRKLFGKTKFFHKPKPPGPDKNKIKKELDADQLKKCGLKLDDAEHFFLELNRLAIADQVEQDPQEYSEAA